MKTKKCRTPNGRFGVMAAVTPRRRQCEIERLYPAGSSVGAATTPSRWDIMCKRQTAQWVFSADFDSAKLDGGVKFWSKKK